MVKENFFKKRAREKIEKEAFEKITKRKVEAAGRRAQYEEAIKVAEEKGRQTARKKTIRQLISERASASLRSRITGTTPAMKRNAGGRFIKKAPARRIQKGVRRSYPTRRFPQYQEQNRFQQPLGEMVIGDLI